MRNKKCIKIVALVCGIVLILLLFFSGVYICRIYYNAEILSCELFVDTTAIRPFYSFKLYGNGKLDVYKYEHIGNIKEWNSSPIFDEVSGLVIEGQGECYLDFRKQIEIIKLINQLNDSDYSNNQATGFLTLARLRFCGNSYIQWYNKPENQRMQADQIAIELINKLIQQSPVEVILN